MASIPYQNIGFYAVFASVQSQKIKTRQQLKAAGRKKLPPTRTKRTQKPQQQQQHVMLTGRYKVILALPSQQSSASSNK